MRPKQWNPSQRIFITVLVGWVPLIALTAISGSRASLITLLKDYRVLARVFIAVPLLIGGRTLIEERFRLIVQHFSDAGLLKPADSPKFGAILATVKKLKQEWFPKLSLVAFGCVGGILLVHGGPERYAPDHQAPCEPWLFVLRDEAENYFVPAEWSNAVGACGAGEDTNGRKPTGRTGS
jgi:hypothetical protein